MLSCGCPRPDAAIRIGLRVRRGTPDVNPWRLLRSLTERVAGSEVPVVVGIDASQSTNTGYVLTLADMAFAGGAAGCTLTGAPPPASRLETPQPQDAPGDARLDASGLTLDATAATPPPFDASQAQLVGFTNDDLVVGDLWLDEEIELEEESAEPR